MASWQKERDQNCSHENMILHTENNDLLRRIPLPLHTGSPLYVATLNLLEGEEVASSTSMGCAARGMHATKELQN